MWLTGQLHAQYTVQPAQAARITLAQQDVVAVSGASENRTVQFYAPYGYAALPPERGEALLLPCGSNTACVGARMERSGLQAGEIRLLSAGGAQIILKNNGEILLNGLRITRDGTLVQKGGSADGYGA